MEGEGANMVSELVHKLLLNNVEVCSRGFGGFGCTAQMSDCILPDLGRNLLLRDLSFPVAQPINLASTNLPFVTNCSLELGLCQAWGQAAQDELQAWLGSFGTPGSLLGRSISSLQDCDRQDAVDARLRGHGRGSGCGGLR